MGLALLASLLLKKLSHSTINEELKKELVENSEFAFVEFISFLLAQYSIHFLKRLKQFSFVHIRYFSQLAIDWLKEAHAHNGSFAAFQLCVAQPLVGDVTCLDLASWNQDKKFLSHAASQRVLKQVWMGHLCETSSNQWCLKILQFLLALFLPPLASCLLTFREPAQRSLGNARVSIGSNNRACTSDYFTLPLPPAPMNLKCCSSPASKTCCSSLWAWLIKMILFFNAPIIVYSYNLVCPTCKV